MVNCSLKNIFLISISCIPAHKVVVITENLKLRTQRRHHLLSAQGRGQWWGWEPRGSGVPRDWIFTVCLSQESAWPSFCGVLCLLEDFYQVCMLLICSRNNISPSQLGYGRLRAGRGYFSSCDFLGLSSKKSEVTINLVSSGYRAGR